VSKVFLRQSTSQVIRFGPFLDSTDGITAETGLTIANTDMQLSKDGGVFGNKNSGGGTHDVDGWYSATLDATDTATVGILMLQVVISGAIPVWHEYYVVEEAVYDALYAASAAGPLQSTTAGRTLDVTAAGTAGIDWGNVENASSTVDLSDTAINLCDTITTYTGNTVQTGDAFARLGAPAGASVSADIGVIDGNVDLILVDTSTTLDGKLDDIQGATFNTATDSLEAIRNRGDAAWTTGGGGGGSDRLLMIDTTIATLASQTSFTLDAGSADDDAYNNLSIVVEDVATATQKAVGMVLDYTGSTKTVTLKEALAFTIAATDKVYILADNSLKSTVANRQIDVTASTGKVTVGTNDDKTGYSVSGTITTLDGLNNFDPSSDTVATVTDVTNRVTANTDQIAGDATAATNLSKSATGIEVGAAIAGTLSITQMTTDLTETTDDHYNGRIIVWTSGVLKNQATDITDYTGSTKLLTYTATTDAPSATDEFVIV
jgi:hypothetical protein